MHDAGEGRLHPCVTPGSIFGSDVLSLVLCAPAGITNYDEYSLVREIMEEKKEEVTGTLKKDKTLLRDEKKMEKLKQKLHTDDECRCLHALGKGSAHAKGSREGSRAPCKGKSWHRGAEATVESTVTRVYVSTLPGFSPAWRPRAEARELGCTRWTSVSHST